MYTEKLNSIESSNTKQESNEELVLIEIKQIKEQLDLQNKMISLLLKRTEHLVRHK